MKFILLFLSALSLASCSSYFKRKTCESTNWFEYGQSVALEGRRQLMVKKSVTAVEVLAVLVVLGGLGLFGFRWAVEGLVHSRTVQTVPNITGKSIAGAIGNCDARNARIKHSSEPASKSLGHTITIYIRCILNAPYREVEQIFSLHHGHHPFCSASV